MFNETTAPFLNYYWNTKKLQSFLIKNQIECRIIYFDIQVMNIRTPQLATS